MSLMIGAIVFDFGGVLVDWNPRYLYRQFFDDEIAMENFFDEIGFAEWNSEQDKGRPFAQAVSEHSAKFPQHAEMIRAYDERWTESVGGEISETVDILRALKRAGYPLYGLSNWSAEKFALVRAEYKFFDLFDAIVLSGEAKIAKPDTRIFELLLKKIGCPAEDCLFIDDSETNIAAARALNFQTIRFESAEELARELRARGIEV